MLDGLPKGNRSLYCSTALLLTSHAKRDDGICLGWNGTSAATAQLSGVAALMYYYDNTMNRFTVRDILADQNNQVLLGDHPEINGLVKVPEVLDAVRDQRPCNCWVP